MNNVYDAGKKIYEWLTGLGLTAYRGEKPKNNPPAEYVEFSDFSGTSFDSYTIGLYIYVKGTSYKRVVEIADIIGDDISVGGKVIYDSTINMAIKLDRGSPFYQDKPDEDDNIRAGMVNLTITNY